MNEELFEYIERMKNLLEALIYGVQEGDSWLYNLDNSKIAQDTQAICLCATNMKNKLERKYYSEMDSLYVIAEMIADDLDGEYVSEVERKHGMLPDSSEILEFKKRIMKRFRDISIKMVCQLMSGMIIPVDEQKIHQIIIEKDNGEIISIIPDKESNSYIVYDANDGVFLQIVEEVEEIEDEQSEEEIEEHGVEEYEIEQEEEQEEEGQENVMEQGKQIVAIEDAMLCYFDNLYRLEQMHDREEEIEVEYGGLDYYR